MFNVRFWKAPTERQWEDKVESWVSAVDIHYEKSLFVLASRQNIPLLRTEKF